MAYLELNNIYKTYGQGDAKTEVLSNINLEIQEGEFVAIVGFTGSGENNFSKPYKWIVRAYKW